MVSNALFDSNGLWRTTCQQVRIRSHPTKKPVPQRSGWPGSTSLTLPLRISCLRWLSAGGLMRMVPFERDLETGAARAPHDGGHQGTVLHRQL